MKNKCCVKVTLENGNNWTTEINCSYEEAKQYFFSQNVDGGVVQSDETTRSKVISVEKV